MDRQLTQLRQIGVFEKINALIVGRFAREDSDPRFDALFENVLRSALDGTDLPVLANADFGHADPICTLPLGIDCEVTTEPPAIKLLEPAVLGVYAPFEKAHQKERRSRVRGGARVIAHAGRRPKRTSRRTEFLPCHPGPMVFLITS